MAAKRKRPAARGASERVKLPSLAKGIRPEFYDDPAIDQLFAIVTALTGEISVAFDRLDTLEQVLVHARSLPAGAVESYVAQGADAERRARHREELLRRVFAVFEAYAERQRRSAR
jgi:hypothetical protein